MVKSSEKERLVAFLLCFLLGGLGVHRFYVGKVGSGIAQILTLGGRYSHASTPPMMAP